MTGPARIAPELVDELAERIAGVSLVQLMADGVSPTTKLLLDLHAWALAGLPAGWPAQHDVVVADHGDGTVDVGLAP